MAAVGVVPNIALGRINEFINRVNDSDPTNAAIVVILFETGDTIGNLRDFDTIADLLAGVSTESAFTNYVRTVLDDTDIVAPIVDDTGDQQTWELADITPLIPSAGNGTNQDIDMVALAYDPDSTGGTDADLIPFHITVDDAAAPLQQTNGSDLDLTSPTPTQLAEDPSA